MLTDTPIQVVSAKLYKSLLKNNYQTIEIFSTKEKALEWMDINDISINNIINYLKNSL